ncbi:MAG: hypothetical protein PHG00_17710 [Methylococcales bacterium]|nr:hypothetical protein [Methylococcales bacterium]
MSVFKNKYTVKGLTQIVTFLCLGLFMFYGYRILFVANVSEYAKEFTASCLGAVITIMATAVLLKSQLENEVTKDQLADIFKQKMDLYQQYIEFLNSIRKSRKFNDDEIKEFIEWGMKLSLVCRPGVIRIIYEYAIQLIKFDADHFDQLMDEKKIAWKEWMLMHYKGMENDFNNDVFCKLKFATVANIISELREDLASARLADFDENLNMNLILEDLLSLDRAHSHQHEQSVLLESADYRAMHKAADSIHTVL